MAEHVTVEAVKDARDWESQDGQRKLTFYTLDVKRENGITTEVDHARKQGGKEPQPGEELEVIFEEGKFRPKMKKAPQGSFGGGGSERSSGGKGGYERKPRSEYDPEDMARQTHSAAQDRALTALSLRGVKGHDDEELKALIEHWTEWFERGVIQAGKAAKQGQSAPQQESASTPPGSASSGPVSQPADTHQWMTKLLEDAAMDSTAAHALGGFIAEKFSAEQVKRAEAGLQTLETQGETVDKLRLAYEKATGELLPLASDDDVPF
jgi:hypothetical protein